MERRLAEAALDSYGLRDARLKLLRRRFVQVFRVVSRRGKYSLRLYGLLQSPASETPRGYSAELRTGVKLRSPEVVRSQALWLSALGRETDLLVPEPVPTPDGSLLGHISTDELAPGTPRMSRHFALMRWVPGRHKMDELTPVDLSLVGLFLARLHNHAERYAAPEGSVFPRWDWEWSFGESAPLWSEGEAFYSVNEMALFEVTARRVREDLRQMGEGSDVFGLIHGDSVLDNVVFDEGRVGIIDFDSCGWGYYLSDLSRMSKSLENLYQGRPHGPLLDALLEGYDRERSLPQGYQRHLQTFDAMQEVGAVNRQLALLGRKAALGRGWQNSNRLKNAANRLRRFIRSTA